MDPNGCRAQTPGFEAFGGWIKDNRSELGESRVWLPDRGEDLSDPTNHGANVWRVFSTCAVRSDEDRYLPDITGSEFWAMFREDGRDAIVSRSGVTYPRVMEIPEPGIWGEQPCQGMGGPDQCLDIAYDGHRDGQRLLEVRGAGNDDGMRTIHLYFPHYQLALQDWDKALIILVGGYGGFFVDEEDKRNVNSNSSVCGDADALCLFAPWSYSYSVDDRTTRVTEGTSFATPQVAAALDSAWAVWPDMDILDLRNLAFDCAENQDPREGESSTERTYSYRNGRSFTSNTNPTWGHGILSLTCLFTPNGGLQNPVTGNAISGGIYGPLAGPVTGASITGVDYTGRAFGYGFVRPVARENWALQVLARSAAVMASAARSREYALNHGSGDYSATSWGIGDLRVNLTVAAARGGEGKVLGFAAQGQIAGLTVRTGIAVQPEGVGSLTGSRAFRAPASVSAALTLAYGHRLTAGLSAHLQADHWRTVATRGRSLWEAAALRESRFTAALVRRFGRHEMSLQGIWRSGLSGSLDVGGRVWPVAPGAERGVWVTWKR